MLIYDKQEIKNALTVENISELLDEWSGEPQITPFGIIALTICHHRPTERGSRKLYYYANSGLFKCFTGGCEDPTFDIFQLVIKIMKNYYNKDYSLYDAILWIANRFGFAGQDSFHQVEATESDLIFSEYNRLDTIKIDKIEKISLKEYDADILNRFHYDIVIKPWIDDKIDKSIMQYNGIGYYPGKEQIVIPHYDIDNRLIGIRGRTLAREDAELYGKYRPLLVNKQLYNHPLGMNLYNLNHSKDNISILKKAVVFESEKAAMRYQTEFGIENDISVACCGSNLSAYQIYLLKQVGVEEIIVAFDRDFQEIGDARFNQIKNNYIRLHNKYKNEVLLSFIFDKEMITKHKSSPIDEDKDKFLYLFKHRILL